MSARNNQLYLSPVQQDLLMAALSSNQSSPATLGARGSSRNAGNDTATPQDLFDSPPNVLDFSPDENAYMGFDLDGEFDDNLDVNETQDNDNGETVVSYDLHDKRKSLDGKDDDDEGGGKRRESEDKSGKKPGRKPLTSEPTSKRKAQNRAAQRAFRERKEKHLRDLETKVEDLEKRSEATNHENGLLRAQVERLQVELKEYRKRLSWVSSNGLNRLQQLSLGQNSQMKNSNAFNNDFQFEFPKFGDLPAVPPMTSSGMQKQDRPPVRSSTLPAQGSNRSAQASLARNSASSAASRGPATVRKSPQSQTYSGSPISPNQHADTLDSFSGLFSPSILEASRNSAYGYFPRQNANRTQVGRSSFDNGLGGNSTVVYASSSNTDSPSSSSDSHQPTSSIGTSPEPSLNSPGQKQIDMGLNSIDENRLSGTFGDATNPTFESNGFNWLAEQNGGGFDPILFGDYRESQDAVISQDFGSFFNDAFPLPDLGSPQHNFNDVAAEPGLKHDLLKQVDAAREGEDEMVPGEDRGKMMSCTKIWDKLQSMEKFRNGEIDVDNLCSELRAKARCSEGGAVVEEKDLDRILREAK